MKLIVDLFKYAAFYDGVHFLCFQLEISFLGKFGPKSQNCQFKLKIGTRTNADMQNSLVMFPFSVLDWKYFAGQIWSEKLKLSV